MSIKRVASVWELSRQRDSGRLVMLCLADHARDSGYCYPSVARIARMTLLSKRTVYRALRDAEAAGELYIDRERYANRYLVTLGVEPHTLIDELIARFGMSKQEAHEVQRSITKTLLEIQHGDNLSPLAEKDMVTTETRDGDKLSPGVTDGAGEMVTDCPLHGDTVSPYPSEPSEEEPSAELSDNHVSGMSGEGVDYQRQWERVLEAVEGRMDQRTFDHNLRGSVCLGPNGDPNLWRVRVRNLGSPEILSSPQMARKVAIIERELGEGIRVTFEAGT